MFNLEIALAVCLAYLIGSLSSAIIVCKIVGLPDPRTKGSGNPGATNVLRLGGKGAAGITLAGDMLKGFIPVLAAKWLGFSAPQLALIAFAAFLGHLYPIFFRFAGGKGVATALGALLALSWPSGLLWLTTWLIVAILFSYSSLAALIASLLSPLYIGYFTHQNAYIIAMIGMSLLLIFRHRKNIARLLSGTESKIGRRYQNTNH